MGSASGVNPVSAICSSAVAVGEVTEGGVARDDLPAVAPGKTAFELSVERL